MTLEEKIENEFKKAMKARDAVKVSTIRMLKAEANNIKLEKNKKILTDAEMLKVVSRQVKQHKDSIEQFGKGGRNDLVEKEEKELAILCAYMPEQLSEEALTKIAEETIKELGATGKKDTGRVIKSVMEKTKLAADGKTVSRIVSGRLGQA